MSGDSSAGRAELLADVVARRERLMKYRRRARWSERAASPAIAVAVALAFRVAWTGGIFGRLLGVTTWLLTVVVFFVALVAARGAIATVAARWLVPARRDLVAAESRLRAHDTAFGRGR